MVWPVKPDFPPLADNDERAEIFGHFDYIANPIKDNKEHIKILGSWEKDNIMWVEIPQMEGLDNPDRKEGMPPGMLFHRLGATQLQAMWADWEANDLIKLIKEFDGSFVARFVRGSNTNLSNHSFGTAFDINYEWNHLGELGADVDEEGTVRPLVHIANKHGFFWGGHYNSRKDPMHFELAQVFKPS